MMMDDSALVALLNDEVRNSMGYIGKLALDREKALFYYRGEAKGDLSPPDVDGRSSVVSSDLMDTVEWIMPQLMRIFMSGEDVVEFAPRKADSEASAKLITQYVNYIMQHDNDGFRVIHTCIKDALIEKMGVAKVYWTEEDTQAKESYEGLSPEAFALIQKDDDMELRQATQRMDDDTGTMVIDAVFARTTSEGRICVEPVPAEEFLYSRDTKSIETSRFCCHRTQKTISYLREKGYPEDLIKDIGSDEGSIDTTGERVQRAMQDDENAFNHLGDASQDASSRKVWINECHIQVDYDGDGLVEWRKVVKCGNVILENIETDGNPFAVFTPILMSHRMVGLSMYDLVNDLQRIKTALLRQTLDNSYLINNGRYLALNDRVNLDDLLTVRPGGIVRVDQMDAVMPLPTQPISAAVMPLLEYVDDLRQRRTGVTAHTQGVSSDSLNKTATGAQIGEDNSQARIELIARTISETAVKRLYQLIFQLVCKHQNQPRMMRVAGNYVPVDPREWVNEYDMTINVGMGMGNKLSQQNSLQAILGIQQQALSANMLPPVKILSTLRRLTEAMGYKNVDTFWPTDQEAMQLEQQQTAKPPQDPILIQQQIEAQRGQTAQAIQGMKTQSETHLAEQQKQITMAVKAQDIQAEQQKQANERSLAEYKIKLEYDYKMAALQATIVADREKMMMQVNPEFVMNQEAEKMNSQAIAEMVNQLAQAIAGLHQSHQAGQQNVLTAITAPREVIRDKMGNMVGSRMAQ